MRAEIGRLVQYGRKCMVELSGLPRTKGEDVQNLFISMTEKSDATVTSDEVEACHRNLTRSDAPIIAEVNIRMLRNKVLAAKKKLQDLKVQYFAFPAPVKDEEGKERLRNRYSKNQTVEHWNKFRKQRNSCVKSFRREKRNYYNNLDILLFTDNKKYWKIVKPFFSEKS